MVLLDVVNVDVDQVGEYFEVEVAVVDQVSQFVVELLGQVRRVDYCADETDEFY